VQGSPKNLQLPWGGYYLVKLKCYHLINMTDEKPKEAVATQAVPEDPLSSIPSQYRDLPADMVEELWAKKSFLDPEKDKEQTTKRKEGLEALRARDLQASTTESAELNQRLETYGKGGTDVESVKGKVLAEFIAPLLRADAWPDDIGLSLQEKVVLSKMAELYKKAKTEKPNEPVKFQFSQPNDQLVFNNLIARQALESLKNESVQKDDVAREKIQREIGAESEKKGKFTAEEIAELNKPVAERYFAAKARGEQAEEFNQTLEFGGKRIDWRLGEHFDAHGIAKGMPEAQLRSLLNLLDNGIDPSREFSTAPLEVDPDSAARHDGRTAGGSAYKSGSFVVLGAPGTKEHPSLGIVRGGIKAVIVNDAYFHAVDRLQQAYPDVKFIRADKVNEGLQELMDAVGKGAPKTEAPPTNEPASAAETVKAAFDAMRGGIEQGALDKVSEYDQRIRAAQGGKPMKAGDTVAGLLKDFKFFAREDWTDQFKIDDFAKRRKQQA
jgi:hypothetical protein